ncbi:hypothetical protein P8452_44813 [Trifolium repens]|nr:hypothetical protein P8452_44813 [Trifolium repens]
MKWIPCAGEDCYPLDACVGDLMVDLGENSSKTCSKTFPSFPDEDYRDTAACITCLSELAARAHTTF